MKIKIFFLLFLSNAFIALGQSYNQDRTALKNFLVRMFEKEPFDGVRVVEDYENTYLMSVVALDKTKYKNQSTLNRVAHVKAMSQASRFFNGSKITDDIIITTSEKADGTSDTEIIEHINENSVGYVKALELLTVIPSSEETVCIFLAPIKQK